MINSPQLSSISRTQRTGREF